MRAIFYILLSVASIALLEGAVYNFMLDPFLMKGCPALECPGEKINSSCRVPVLYKHNGKNCRGCPKSRCTEGARDGAQGDAQMDPGNVATLLDQALIPVDPQKITSPSEKDVSADLVPSDVMPPKTDIPIVLPKDFVPPPIKVPLIDVPQDTSSRSEIPLPPASQNGAVREIPSSALGVAPRSDPSLTPVVPQAENVVPNDNTVPLGAQSFLTNDFHSPVTNKDAHIPVSSVNTATAPQDNKGERTTAVSEGQTQIDPKISLIQGLKEIPRDAFTNLPKGNVNLKYEDDINYQTNVVSQDLSGAFDGKTVNAMPEEQENKVNQQPKKSTENVELASPVSNPDVSPGSVDRPLKDVGSADKKDSIKETSSTRPSRPLVNAVDRPFDADFPVGTRISNFWPSNTRPALIFTHGRVYFPRKRQFTTRRISRYDLRKRLHAALRNPLFRSFVLNLKRFLSSVRNENTPESKRPFFSTSPRKRMFRNKIKCRYT